MKKGGKIVKIKKPKSPKASIIAKHQMTTRIK